jgi:cytochrome c-type biogenesis protein CcmF
MLCFIFVVYSTFLTRSGVLGDTSVHSFVDPGMWAYWLLIMMIVLFVSLGIGMLLRRLREMPKAPVHHGYWSREFALFLGSASLVCAAIFITVGTSSPIITEILQNKKTAVDISYYVTTTVPIGILIGLLSGIGQLLWWTRSKRGDVLRGLIAPAVFAALVTVVVALFGLRNLQVGLLVFGAAFALGANIQVGLHIVKGNPKYAGGSVAHIGIAIMLLGFVASSVYDSKQTLSLAEGKTVEALGYKLTYNGFRPIGGEKYAFDVHVEKDGVSNVVAPIMYYSSYTQGLMRTPDIANLITKDFYLAPLSLEQKGGDSKASVEKMQLRKGETKKFGDIEVMFDNFEFPVMEKAAMLEGRAASIGARLHVKEYGKKATEVTPSKLINQGETTDKPARYADKYEFIIVGMRPDREAKENSTVEIGIRNLGAPSTSGGSTDKDVLVVEASVKPFINLVWAGVIILLVGFLITIVRRAQEARLRNTSPG